MKFLKQGVCLALLGAGLAAAPASLATSATATPSASVAGDRGLVRDLRGQADGTVSISNDPATGEAGFIRATGAQADLLPGVAADTAAAAGAKADAFVDRYGAVLGAETGQLTQEDVTSNGYGGWTATYTQSYRGVPVFGALLRAHIDSEGDLTAVNGYAAPGLDLSTTPRRTAAEAASAAMALVRNDPGPSATGEGRKLGRLKTSDPELYVYRDGAIKGEDGVNRLVYVTDVTDGAALRERVFTDASTGKLVNRYSMTDNALNRELREAGGTKDNPTFTTVWKEGDPFPGNLNQDQQNLVISSGESYWFFRNAFGRDSYDGNGAKRITVNNDPRINCPNANWNGVTTNYCNGVTSDDVVAHEWGHAYTEYTHGLIYQWQPGALNESYSDIWGETLDLINGREDEGEGDIAAPRTSNLCADEGPRAVQVVINSPANIAKVCLAGVAAWSKVPTTTGITSDIVLAQDGTAPDVNDGCTAPTNAAAISGHVALVKRGNCDFTVKANNLKAAGATAVVIGNNNGGGPFSPGGTLTPALDIPVVGISQADSDRIIGGLAAGPVNTTVRLSGTAQTADSFRWLVGEKSTAFGGAIRDMWVPTCAGDPGKVSDIEYSCGTDDSGGVHSNSGVPNHGYALLVDGGTFNGVTVSGIGLDKAASIYYQAMTHYQTPTSDFADHANALEASCTDLVGKPIKKLTVQPNATPTAATPIAAADCAQVTNMIAAVELRKEPTQCNFQPLLKQGGVATCGTGAKTKTVYRENFEDGLAGWERDTEIAFTGGISAPWQADSSAPGGHAGGVARGVDDDEIGDCTNGAGDASSRDSITSPTFTMPSGTNAPKLSFEHYIATEFGYDGGNVKVSVNEGAFSQIPASAFLFNGYNSTLQPTNPLGGQAGFTGTDGGQVTGSWGTTVVDLAALGVKAGDSVRLRFDMGRDGCGGLDGWYVDNITVTTCDTPAAGPAESTTTLKIRPKKLSFREDIRAKIKVKADGTTPEGKVKLFANGMKIGKGELENGKLKLTIERDLKPGDYRFVAKYLGSGTVAASKDVVTTEITR